MVSIAKTEIVQDKQPFLLSEPREIFTERYLIHQHKCRLVLFQIKYCILEFLNEY